VADSGRSFVPGDGPVLNLVRYLECPYHLLMVIPSIPKLLRRFSTS